MGLVDVYLMPKKKKNQKAEKKWEKKNALSFRIYSTCNFTLHPVSGRYRCQNFGTQLMAEKV